MIIVYTGKGKDIVKVTVHSLSEIKKELLIEVPVEVIDAAVKKETEKIRKNVQIHGFRKGKAPLQIIRAQHGPKIEATAVEETINEQYREAIASENLNPIAPADISDLDYTPGTPLKFKATIEIEPEIVIGDWKGMVIEKEEPEVTDKLVEDALNKLQYRFATVMTKEGAAEVGDQVLLDFTEVDPTTGIELIGKKYTERSIKLGENTYGPEIDQGIVGLKAGEFTTIKRPVESQLIVNPSQDRQQPIIEAFHIAVKKVESIELPELDDELAKDMNYDSFDALKDGARANLLRQLEDASRNGLRSNIEREAVRIVNPPVPEIMVERYLDNMIEMIKKHSKEPVDLKKLREKSRESARGKVQWFLIRQKIIDTEGFTVADQEIDDHLKRFAEENNLDYERIRIKYRSGENRENIKDDLLNTKVYSLLETKSEIRTIKKQTLEAPADYAD